MKIIRNRERVEYVRYSREFEYEDDERTGSGFSFPCDEHGDTSELNPSALKNFKWCLEHPEEIADLGIVKTTQNVTNPAVGLCKCGTEVCLYDEYLGACSCPECGQWYNLFGQELVSPEAWED